MHLQPHHRWPLLAMVAALAGVTATSVAMTISALIEAPLLAGLFAQQQALASELDAAFGAGPARWAELWQRDQGLLRIAEAARAKRLEKARRIVASC